jgi:hypothetical protein
MTPDRSPAPPDGYQRYRLDSEPSIGIFARAVAAGWVLAVVVLGGLVFLYHERYGVGVVGVVLVTVVVHEVIHAAAGRLFGLQVTAGFDVGGLESGPYILPHGGFQTRRESALMAAAPTLVLAPVFVLLAVVGGTTVALAALAALFINTIGAVFDLRAVMTAFRLPGGALAYPAADGEMHFYAPVSAG